MGRRRIDRWFIDMHADSALCWVKEIPSVFPALVDFWREFFFITKLTIATRLIVFETFCVVTTYLAEKVKTTRIGEQNLINFHQWPRASAHDNHYIRDEALNPDSRRHEMAKKSPATNLFPPNTSAIIFNRFSLNFIDILWLWIHTEKMRQ